MNTRMIGILIGKDMRLMRLPVLGYLAGGTLAVGMMGMGSEAWFYAGCVLLITALMALSFHPAIATTVGERKEHTLAFIMSMPVTATDYTWAKLLANLLLFFGPWLVLMASTLSMITARASMPDGMVPYAAILFGAIAASALLILFVAIVTESMQWTIAAQIVCNLLFQAVMYSASKTAAIRDTMHGETPVWNEAVLLFIGVEIVLSAILFGATLWFQSKKTDFI